MPSLTVDQRSTPLCESYVSIPQANKNLQGLAISTLATYAMMCCYFLVLAPDAVHKDKQTPCNHATYRKRGWVRRWASNQVACTYAAK